MPSLLYGGAVFVLSALIIWLLFRFELDYALFPALAGFMVVAPFLTLGLYEKSRRIHHFSPNDPHPPTIVQVRFVHGGNAAWIAPARDAGGGFNLGTVLWYPALPGADDILRTLFLTRAGWGLLMTGGAVGGLFAAFAFAISVFSVPALLRERVDAMTALARSLATVWNNLPVMLTWASIVFGMMVLSLATSLFGLIIVVPVLGHATWHAFRAIWREE